ncbi:MAG: hypothetical protein U0263_27760 [Polyangiaceae bacterium]
MNTRENPYRTRAQHAHIPAVPVHPAWKSYQRNALFYNVVLWTSVVVWAGYLMLETRLALSFLIVMWMPFIVFLMRVRDCACPECHDSIVDGPLVLSYWRYYLGLFPNYCTNCGAPVPDGPTQPECDCERCRKETY